jgi:hypothetical protein
MKSAFDAAQNNNLDADISNEQRRIEAEARATTPQENDRVAAANARRAAKKEAESKARQDAINEANAAQQAREDARQDVPPPEIDAETLNTAINQMSADERASNFADRERS